MNSENSDVIYRSSPEKILNGVRSDSSKKVNKKTINFTPVYSSDKIMKNSNKNFLSFSNYTQNELESNEDDKQINLSDDNSSKSILVPKRNISTKNLDKYNDSFDEIIKNLSSLPLSKKKKQNSKREFRKYSSFHPEKKNSKNIKTFLQENSDEIKALSNIEEINDFKLYNETCISYLDDLVPINKNLPKVSFEFFENIPKKKKLCIFDLDETLVHSEYKDINSAQNIITVTLPSDKKVKVGLNIRPHWKKAIKEISKTFYILIYTASDHHYADAVLDFMDPEKKYLNYRLYRRNCLYCNVKNDNLKFYVKDLSILDGVDLKDVVIVDNSLLSYAFQLNNGIPIMPYYNNKKDFELMLLAGYLNAIYEFDDLREANKKFIRLENLVKNVKNKYANEDNDKNTDSDKKNFDEPMLIRQDSPVNNYTNDSVISGFLDEVNKK
jgi:Dullard-like phosphatase family protein